MVQHTYKKTALSLLLGFAVAGVAMANSANSIPDFLRISEAEAEVTFHHGKSYLELEIKTEGKIPDDGKSGAFGYAALTDQGNNVLVLTTHLPIDDSSHEDPKSGFHAHVLDLKAPTEGCKGANFEVDVASSKQNSAFDADYRWKLKGNEISVEDVPTSDLGDAGVESVVSFTLKPVFDDNEQLTNLCVTVTG